MPALNFELEWPDGDVMECYSPSTIVLQYLKAGDTHTVSEMVTICRTALDMANKRVEERFGFQCAASAEQKEKIIRRAALFDSDQTVRILNIKEHET